MADDETPIRIICDTCMTDVDVERIVGPPGVVRLLLRCHGTEELLHESRLPGWSGGYDKRVFVWSNLVNVFTSQRDLFDLEKRAVESLLAQIADVRIYHRVRRAQGAAPTYFAVDEAVDTLMLFRRDPALPPPPEPEPVKREPVEDPSTRRNREYLEKIAAQKKNAELMRARAGKKNPNKGDGEGPF